MRTLLPQGILQGERQPGKEGEAMEMKELKNHLGVLATLNISSAPLLSVFLNLSDEAWRQALEARIQGLRNAVRGTQRAEFELAVGQIQAFLANRVLPTTRGLAIYARAGEWPFFLGLQFHVPLENQITVGETPVLYPLVELKDNFDRYVVLVALKEGVRIFEVDLGAVTRDLWARRPELRGRVRAGWTRDHWRQGSKGEDGDQFWDAKVKLLERLMNAGGHAHLILAGDKPTLDQVRKRLPKPLLAKVIDLLKADVHDRMEDVVFDTLSSFIAREEQESRSVADTVFAEFKKDGLAVVGMTKSLWATALGAVDTVVLLRSYKAGPGWACRACGRIEEGAAPRVCSNCGGTPVTADLREELLRLAQNKGAKVEVVGLSESLSSLGGLGCLLRYQAAVESPVVIPSNDPLEAQAIVPYTPSPRRLHFARAKA